MGFRKHTTTALALGLLVGAFQNCSSGFSSIDLSSDLAPTSSAQDSNSSLPIDPAAPLQVLAQDSSQIIDGILRAEIRLNKPDSDNITVHYATSPGTATTPEHFFAIDDSVTIPAGQTSVTVQLPVLASGTAPLTFGLNIKSTSKGLIGRATAQLTIAANSVAGPFLPKVSVAQHFACGINPQNELKCWGNGFNGQLGDGTNVSRNTPSPVIGVSQVKQVSAGDWHVCALTNQGAVSCWGAVTNFYNYGQLGNGSTTGSLTPVTVQGLPYIKQISSGFAHTCALTAQHTVLCWGLGRRLGNNATANSSVPVAVQGLQGVRHISSGSDHTCAVTAWNTVFCWGGNNGKLGNNATEVSLVPVPATGLSQVKQVAASSNHTCAVTLAGKVYCWGYNGAGQLGNNSTTASLVPIPVPGLDGIKQVSSAYQSTCALNGQNQVSCWGYNFFGQLGNGTQVDSLVPTPVPGLSNVQELSLGDGENSMLCATTPLGLQCWGNSGNSATVLLPTTIQGF